MFAICFSFKQEASPQILDNQLQYKVQTYFQFPFAEQKANFQLFMAIANEIRLLVIMIVFDVVDNHR